MLGYQVTLQKAPVAPFQLRKSAPSEAADEVVSQAMHTSSVPEA